MVIDSCVRGLQCSIKEEICCPFHNNEMDNTCIVWTRRIGHNTVLGVSIVNALAKTQVATLGK